MGYTGLRSLLGLIRTYTGLSYIFELHISRFLSEALCLIEAAVEEQPASVLCLFADFGFVARSTLSLTALFF